MKSLILKKLIVGILLLSMGVMIIPQTAYAGWYPDTVELNCIVGTEVNRRYTVGDGSMHDITTSGDVPVGMTLEYGVIEGEPQFYGTPTCEALGNHTIVFTDTFDNSTLTVNIHVTGDKGIPVISLAELSLNRQVGDSDFKILPILKKSDDSDIGSGCIPACSFSSSNPGVATVNSGGWVTILSAGTTEITVSSIANTYYEAATPVTCTLTVTGGSPTPTPPANQSNTTGDSKNEDKKEVKSEEIYQPTPHELYIQKQTALIQNAKAGETVIISSDIFHSYPLEFMKLIQKRSDINFTIEYNYKGFHYKVTIPAGTKFALDQKIPWYGPLKIALMFGAEITPIVK